MSSKSIPCYGALSTYNEHVIIVLAKLQCNAQFFQLYYTSKAKIVTARFSLL